MSLQELTAAVAVLPPTELEAFTQWFEEYRAVALDPTVQIDAVLTNAQRCELERRADDDDANPDDGVPWDRVKAEALARWGR